MALDILGAFRRMVTLPAAHNSLSDLLGEQAAHVVAQTVHALLADAVMSALHAAVLAGETQAERLGGHVMGAVKSVLHGVSPALGAVIEARIHAAIGGAEAVAEGSLPGIASAVVKEVSGVLKLSEN